MVLRTNKRFNFIYIFYAIAKQFKKCPPQFYVCVCAAMPAIRCSFDGLSCILYSSHVEQIYVTLTQLRKIYAPHIAVWNSDEKKRLHVWWTRKKTSARTSAKSEWIREKTHTTTLKWNTECERVFFQKVYSKHIADKHSILLSSCWGVLKNNK